MTLAVIIYSAIIPIIVSVISSLLVHKVFTERQNRIKYTTEIIKDFLQLCPTEAAALASLRTPAVLAGPDRDSKWYEILRVGDWFEILLLLHENNVLDAKLLGASNVLENARAFRDAFQGSMSQVHTDAARELKARLLSWSHLSRL